jgi:hypothetical protein
VIEMFELIIAVLAIVALAGILDLVALRFGVDSRPFASEGSLAGMSHR